MKNNSVGEGIERRQRVIYAPPNQLDPFPIISLVFFQHLLDSCWSRRNQFTLHRKIKIYSTGIQLIVRGEMRESFKVEGRFKIKGNSKAAEGSDARSEGNGKRQAGAGNGNRRRNQIRKTLGPHHPDGNRSLSRPQPQDR